MVLTPREITIVDAIRDPGSGNMKRIAHDLGISYRYLKLRTYGIYEKLGWAHDMRDIRRLTLWAVSTAHAK